MESIGVWIFIISFITAYVVFKHLRMHTNKHQKVTVTMEGPQPLTRTQVLKMKQEDKKNKLRLKNFFETKIRPRLNKQLGTDTPNCPYCGIPLSKMPVRATVCKSCKNKFYVRTRPYDEKKIIMTEKDIQELDAEWKLISFMKELGDKYFICEEELKELRHTNSIPPADVFWWKISHDRLKAELSQDIVTLSNVLRRSGSFLISENRYSEALEDLLLYIYYNGILIRYESDGKTTRVNYMAPEDPWISLCGDVGRCVLELDVSKKQLIETFLSLEPVIQTGVSLDVFVPNLCKAYDELIEEKRNFEEEYGTPYLGVTK